MLTNAKFWYGLGAGMIITSFLLRLMTAGSSAEVPSEQADFIEPDASSVDTVYKPVTEEDIRAHAQALGYYSEEELAEAVALAKETAVREALSEAQETVTEHIYYVFRIAPGTGSDAVVKLLYEVGLISDEAAFRQTLTDLNLHTRIQPGFYKISADTGEAEIAGIITKTAIDG